MNEKEAVINAVAHRDYFEKGANVMVEMFDDRIEITNFGGLVKGLKPADFGTKSVLRNPNIAGLLHRVKYIEKMGTGINKMRGLMAEAGLLPIEFEFDAFFTATFYRPAKKEATSFDESGGVFEAISDTINDTISEPITEGIKKRLTKELIHIVEQGFITREIIENTSKISTATAKRDLSLLKRSGLIKFEGARKTGRYVLTEKGKKMIEVLKE